MEGILVLNNVKIFLFLPSLFREDYDQVIKVELMSLFLKMLCWQLSSEKMINGTDSIKEERVVWILQMVFKGQLP